MQTFCYSTHMAHKRKDTLCRTKVNEWNKHMKPWDKRVQNKARKNAWFRSKAIHPASESIWKRYGTDAALLNDGRFRVNPYRHYSDKTWKTGLTVWEKDGIGGARADQFVPHLMMLRRRVRSLFRWVFPLR